MARQHGVGCGWVLMHADGAEARLEAAAHALEPSAETEHPGTHKAFWKTSSVALLWSCALVAMSLSPTWMDARGPGGTAGLGGTGM